MYHMALPPHFGAMHPPTIHSTVYAGPVPPGSQVVHTFSPEIPQSTSRLQGSPSISMYQYTPSQQPAVYVNPYLGHPSQNTHHYQHVQPYPEAHLHNLGCPSSVVTSACQLNRHIPSEHLPDRRQPLSVDEEIFEEMTTLHLGYMETEDSPHKMEQREKLENVIMEYLSITPHSHKFMFHQVLDVLERSVNNMSAFSAHDAAHGFDALAQYAANLISQPWRKEFRELQLHNGFWIHQVSSHLSGAESILELMGYICVSGEAFDQVSPVESARARGIRSYQAYYVLQGILDPDLISRLALDCMIAYCECQSLRRLYEGVIDYGLTWSQILQFRQHYIGGVDVTLRHLLFSLRQRVGPSSYEIPNLESAISSSSPEIPALPISSFVSSAASHSKPTTPNMTSHVFEVAGKAETSSTQVEGDLSSVNYKDSLSHYNSAKKVHSRRGLDLPDGTHVSRGNPKSLVPTAKLIDLDSSHESWSNLLPKVLPRKSNLKDSSHMCRNNLYGTEPDVGFSVPSPPPPPTQSLDAFQPGTLEEHLEATLNLVKNPTKSAIFSADGKTPDRNSWETWDFVFKGLEKKGYKKDAGDRGDLLHEKNLMESDSNISLNNQRRDFAPKNRPLTINQALQQFTLNETKERIDKPRFSSNKSSHSYLLDNHKRNSLYDNVSGGFETALQGSDNSDDRRGPPQKKISGSSHTESRKTESFRNCSSTPLFHRVNNSREAQNSYSTVSNPDEGDGTLTDTELDVASDSSAEKWSCATCTYLNNAEKCVCEMCGKSRDPGPDTKPLVSGGKQCPRCTLINDRDTDDCSACGSGLKGSSTYI